MIMNFIIKIKDLILRIAPSPKRHRPKGISRRKVLGWMGLGAAGSAVSFTCSQLTNSSVPKPPLLYSVTTNRQEIDRSFNPPQPQVGRPAATAKFTCIEQALAEFETAVVCL